MISAGDPKIPAKKVDGDRLAARALGHESADLWTKEQLEKAAAEKAQKLAQLEAEQALKALTDPNASKVDIAKAKALVSHSSKGAIKTGLFASSARAVAASRISVEEKIASALLGDATDQKGQLAKRLVEEYMRLS